MNDDFVDNDCVRQVGDDVVEDRRAEVTVEAEDEIADGKANAGVFIFVIVNSVLIIESGSRGVTMVKR